MLQRSKQPPGRLSLNSLAPAPSERRAGNERLADSRSAWPLSAEIQLLERL